MKGRHYKARTLAGAQARVRLLVRQYRDLDRLAGRWRRERHVLAKLAADGGPAFDNPLDVIAAELVKDEILEKELGLSPDGKPLPRGGAA